mgnify:CR=1 FL=1
MDKIWDIKILRSRRSLAVVAGMKKPNDHAEPIKVERLKQIIVHTFYKTNTYCN